MSKVAIVTGSASGIGAATAIELSIEGARQVTGETIYIDGGMHIATPR